MKSNYFKLGNLVINRDKVVAVDIKSKTLYLETLSITLNTEKQALTLGAILLTDELPLDMDKAIDLASKTIDEKKELKDGVEQTIKEVNNIKKD
jgi:hypothetical protein